MPASLLGESKPAPQSESKPDAQREAQPALSESQPAVSESQPAMSEAQPAQPSPSRPEQPSKDERGELLGRTEAQPALGAALPGAAEASAAAGAADQASEITPGGTVSAAERRPRAREDALCPEQQQQQGLLARHLVSAVGSSQHLQHSLKAASAAGGSRASDDSVRASTTSLTSVLCNDVPAPAGQSCPAGASWAGIPASTHTSACQAGGRGVGSLPSLSLVCTACWLAILSASPVCALPEQLWPLCSTLPAVRAGLG